MSTLLNKSKLHKIFWAIYPCLGSCFFLPPPKAFIPLGIESPFFLTIQIEGRNETQEKRTAHPVSFPHTLQKTDTGYRQRVGETRSKHGQYAGTETPRSFQACLSKERQSPARSFCLKVAHNASLLYVYDTVLPLLKQNHKHFTFNNPIIWRAKLCLN